MSLKDVDISIGTPIFDVGVSLHFEDDTEDYKTIMIGSDYGDDDFDDLLTELNEED
jgi:hypothetical protein